MGLNIYAADKSGLACPKCGSKDVAGLIMSFWVSLDEEGQPKGQWQDWEGNTELSEKRECAKCFHNWGE